MVKVCKYLKGGADKHKTLTGRRERGESENCNSSKSKHRRIISSGSKYKLQNVSCNLNITDFTSLKPAMPWWLRRVD